MKLYIHEFAKISDLFKYYLLSICRWEYGRHLRYCGFILPHKNSKLIYVTTMCSVSNMESGLLHYEMNDSKFGIIFLQLDWSSYILVVSKYSSRLCGFVYFSLSQWIYDYVTKKNVPLVAVAASAIFCNVSRNEEMAWRVAL